MKRCPTCHRTYLDDTLNFCLDDGEWLLERTEVGEPATAILASGELPAEAPTRMFEPASAITKDSSAENAARQTLRYTASIRNSLIAGVLGILLVMALGVGSYWFYGEPTRKQINSIAVMPFANDSGNPDIEYLSDGMTDSLISSLSQLPNISVKARSSVFRYKGKTTEAPVIGKELGVQAILNGRVVQRGSDITLFVELIEAATEKVLWSENYNRSMTNLVSLQGEIARDVSQKLRTKLSNAQQQQFAKTETANPEAYQLYLRGRFHWNKRTPDGHKKAIENFNEAIALDPNYARAYAGLADAYALYFEYDREPMREFRSKAKEAAVKALSIDNSMAEPHATLGLLALNDYDFATAERELKQAIELDPHYVTAHHWYGNLLSSLGRHGEAHSEFRRALELEPLSLPIHVAYCGKLFFARKYDESIAQSKKILEMDPSHGGVYVNLALNYAMKGDYAQAVEASAKSWELAGRAERAAKVRESFAKGGWHGFLRNVLEEGRQRGYQSPYLTARIYLQLGDKDKAFELLNKSFELRESILTYLKVDPALDALRDDPRYAELIRKVGFPE